MQISYHTRMSDLRYNFNLQLDLNEFILPLLSLVNRSNLAKVLTMPSRHKRLYFSSRFLGSKSNGSVPQGSVTSLFAVDEHSLVLLQYNAIIFIKELKI